MRDSEVLLYIEYEIVICELLKEKWYSLAEFDSGLFMEHEKKCRLCDWLAKIAIANQKVYIFLYSTKNPQFNMPFVFSSAGDHEEVRLVDGPDAFQGRLQVRKNGVWGTVCKKQFTTRDGDVVCRQLFTTERYNNTPYSQRLRGKKPIEVRNLLKPSF